MVARVTELKEEWYHVPFACYLSGSEPLGVPFFSPDSRGSQVDSHE